MKKEYPEYYKHMRQLLGNLGKSIPDTMGGFKKLHDASMAEGVLGEKEKELIALAIGIAVHCDACISFHVRAALEAGATKDEIAETVGVAILMGGGPSMMYGAEALDAVEQFQQ